MWQIIMKIDVSSHINQSDLHFFLSSSENLDKFPMYIPMYIFIDARYYTYETQYLTNYMRWM